MTVPSTPFILLSIFSAITSTNKRNIFLDTTLGTFLFRHAFVLPIYHALVGQKTGFPHAALRCNMDGTWQSGGQITTTPVQKKLVNW
jgi:hypothetical protein